MRKDYLKPNAEFISLSVDEVLMNQIGGAGSGVVGGSELPPGWGEEEW